MSRARLRTSRHVGDLIWVYDGEGSRQLVRAIFHGKRGEPRQRYRGGPDGRVGSKFLLKALLKAVWARPQARPAE